MNGQQVDFLSRFIDSPTLSMVLDLAGQPLVDEFRSIVLQARRTYLSLKLLAQELPKADLERQLTELTKIAFMLEDFSVDALSVDVQQQDDDPHQTLELAGVIFEYIGDFAPETYSNITAYNWYLHSAVCYSLGRYEANSTVLTQRIADKSKAILEAHSGKAVFEHFLLGVQYGVLLFLARSMHKARKQATDMMELAPSVLAYLGRRKRGSDVFLPQSFSSLRGFLEMASFVRRAAGFMLEGHDEEVEAALMHLANSISIFSGAGMSFETWLGDRLEFLFREMVERSIWKRLAPLREKRPRYLEALVSNEDKPVVELWSSQIAALEQIDEEGTNFGILGGGQLHHAISMPTGAGKTRIAEISIVDAIDPDGNATCVYVAPTRALVTQIAADLSEVLGETGYRIATAAGTYESVPGLDELLIEDCHVLVTTPEKLDMLVRLGAPTVHQAGIFIFDECHKVEDPGRGLRLELLISRLLSSNEDAKFILLSAVLPHSSLGEFVSWLAGDRAVEYYWRPTRLLEGVVVRHIGEQRKDKRSDRKRYETLYAIEYPTLFETDYLLKGTYFKDDGSYRLNRWDVATELALCYAELGPVLIYCPTRAKAQDAAKRFLEKRFQKRLARLQDSAKPSRLRQELTELIEDRLGDDFPLKHLVSLRVAYHHAHLPADVKTEIERAVRNGDILILAATTTLAEGINMPVKTVIFADILYTRWDDELEKQKLIFQIDPKQFRNIAGRAGRALQDTEGHAILLDFYTLQELYSGRKYLLDEFEVQSSFREVIQQMVAERPEAGVRELYLGSQAIENSPVRSRFFDLVNAVRRKSEEKLPQPDDELLLSDEQTRASEEERVHQSEVLALICEIDSQGVDRGLVPPSTEQELRELAQSVMARTLFAQQTKDANIIFEAAVGLTRRHVAAVYRRETARRLLYNQTGLSLTSCEQLESFVGDIVDRFVAQDFPVLGSLRVEGELQFGRLEELLSCVQIPVETRPQTTDRLGIRTSHEQVLFDWISGRSIPAILRDNFGIDDKNKYNTSAKREKQVLIGTNYIYSHLVSFASWALGAMSTLLKDEFERRGIKAFDPELWLLPAYALYGVDSPVALFCAAMDIHDRDVAREVLAPQYPMNLLSNQNYAIPDWSNVKWWFCNLKRETLEKWISRPRKFRATWEAVLKARNRFVVPESLEGSEQYVTSCFVRGLRYENRLGLLPELYRGYTLRLQREVIEEDPNAIQVVLQDGRVLGYVPRELAAIYAPLMDRGVFLYAQVDDIEARRVRIHVFKSGE
jgi:superfamily II DNA/RNA helicase